MTENPNPLEINEYILKAARNRHNVFKSFKKLCEIQKTNLDYVDFEWKYFQFYHGNRDLTIEKSPENSSSLTFDDLPDEMVGEIVSKLDLVNRLKSRRVCRKMLHANPEMSPKIGTLGVTVGKKEIELEFGGRDVEYKKEEDGKCTVRRYERTVTLPEDYVKRALDDFGILLEIPKIRVARFDITIGKYNGSKEVFQLLKNNFSNRVLHVKETFLEAESYEKVLEILAMFKPKILNEFNTRVNGNAKPGDVSGLLAMEQFKHAKVIDILPLVIIDANLIFDNFRHFQDFRVRVHSMSVDQIVRLCQMIISEFASTHFKECIIHIDKDLTLADFKSIRMALGIAEDEEYKIVHCHEIPDFNGAYLEIVIRINAIKVERKAGKKPDNGPGRDFNVADPPDSSDSSDSSSDSPDSSHSSDSCGSSSWSDSSDSSDSD